MKRRVRLTESQLHQVIKESVRRVLCESLGSLEITVTPRFKKYAETVIQFCGNGNYDSTPNEDGTETFSLNPSPMHVTIVPQMIVNCLNRENYDPKEAIVAVTYKGKDILPYILNDEVGDDNEDY